MIRSRGIDASELWVWELPIRMGLAKSSLAINRQSWQWKKGYQSNAAEEETRVWRDRYGRSHHREEGRDGGEGDGGYQNGKDQLKLVPEMWSQKTYMMDEKKQPFEKNVPCYMRCPPSPVIKKFPKKKSWFREILMGLLRLKRLHKILLKKSLNRHFCNTFLRY